MKGKKLLDTAILGGAVGVCSQNSPDRAKWYELLCQKLKPLGVYTENPCSIRLRFYIVKSRLRNDLDNLTKPVFSALEENAISDDSQVFNLDVTKFPVTSFKDESVRIELWEWKGK